MKYKEAINRVPWHACNAFDEVDDNLSMMEESHKEVVRENISKRKAKIRSQSLPWTYSKIRKLKIKRYKLLSEANRTQDEQIRHEYKKMRNRVRRELKQVEANYWKYKLTEVERGSSDFWRPVKDIRKKEKQIGPRKSDSGNLLTGDNRKHEHFFINTGEQLAGKFETSKEVTQ